MAEPHVISALRDKRAELDGEPRQVEKRLKDHGVTETRGSIASKLKRGTFAAKFFLACLAALETEGVGLADI